jgi:hypothetical protein
MRIQFFNWLIPALLLGAAAYALAEEVTLTTYYPSPRGVYKELRTTGNTSLAVDGGNVGIGTTTPDRAFHIQQTNGSVAGMEITNAASGGESYSLVVGSANVPTMAGKFGIYDEGEDYRLVIDTDGNVGIGTTSPQSRLDVAGNIKTSGSLTANSISSSSVGTSNLVVNGPAALNGTVTFGGIIQVGYGGGANGSSCNAPEVGKIALNDSHELVACVGGAWQRLV